MNNFSNEALFVTLAPLFLLSGIAPCLAEIARNKQEWYNEKRIRREEALRIVNKNNGLSISKRNYCIGLALVMFGFCAYKYTSQNKKYSEK